MAADPTGNTSTEVYERAWDLISTIRDECPRDPGDASTEDIVDALIGAGLLVTELPR